MSHLDEGTLHALLDGELDLHEVKQIQAHIGSCAACGTRLREVKDFHGESDRLVSVLQVPNSPFRRTDVADDLGARGEPRSGGPPPPRRPVRTSGPNTEPPPLLIPDNPDQGRARFISRMRWAAAIFVAVGAAYLGRGMQGRHGSLPMAPADSFSSDAVLSSEEATGTAAPESAAGRSGGRDPGQDTAAPAEAKATPRTAAPQVPKRVAPRAETPPADQSGRRESTLTLARSANAEPDGGAASPGGAEPEAQGAVDESVDSAPADTESAAVEESTPSAQRPADVRKEAAAALQQLDRERQLDRARAATAALDSARRREELAARPAVAAPPAPRTPEQRAQIYLRIGLDEAARQLGRPVHVIEGMSPLFMGLAQGKASRGADETRPVVRVVYQDSQGRLILLDQQRLRPAQSTTPPGGSGPRWIQGEISLHLSGEVAPEVLRNLRARVR
jgi:hypothetical protein